MKSNYCAFFCHYSQGPVSISIMLEMAGVANLSVSEEYLCGIKTWWRGANVLFSVLINLLFLLVNGLLNSSLVFLYRLSLGLLSKVKCGIVRREVVTAGWMFHSSVGNIFLLKCTCLCHRSQCHNGNYHAPVLPPSRWAECTECCILGSSPLSRAPSLMESVTAEKLKFLYCLPPS